MPQQFRRSCFARPFIVVGVFVAWAGGPPAGAADAGDRLPDAVTGAIAPDAVMVRMETAVAPAVLEAFKQAHPASFWLFGEDRQLAVRNTIIPAHWFENGAKQFQQFSGVARPGEFYVFQVALVPGAEEPWLDCGVVFDSLEGAQATVLSSSATDPWGSWHGLTFNESRDADNHRDVVLPIWIGVQIPEHAKPGIYPGQVRFCVPSLPSGVGGEKPPFKEQLDFSIKIEGAPLKEGGTGDAWRLARLKWLNSTIGDSKTEVTRPYTPIKVDATARTLDILGRRLTLGGNGIPAQFTSYLSGSNTAILPTGRDAFAAPPKLDCLVGGKSVAWSTQTFEFLSQDPVSVDWRSVSHGGDITLNVAGHLEYDGHLRLSMVLSAPPGNASPSLLDDVRFIVPWRNEVARYAMGLGLQGGLCPPQHQWQWDVAKHQDAVWLGDANLGAMLRFKGESFQRPLINAYYDFRPLNLPESWGSGNIGWVRADKVTTLIASSGPKTLTNRAKNTGGLVFDIDWYLTPFKPLDVKQHFTDRYYHSNQGARLEDTAKLKAAGANIVEIHHNRVCNPYINYPYNSASFGFLQDFVKRAHGDGMRVNLYYTTRELTQNLPEFFALKSMGSEIILSRKEGVAWPVTNPGGPHPWLQHHVGTDIVPAWRENLKFPEIPQKLDLAVITTPDSRWNNFYLEGLDYLIKKAGIDGLYIDDTALDRKSMQRARRILDADGNTCRRVSMHSWNHFNRLAKWSNSAIAFMELYPYYDGLWYGEGFNANASPEYMLVEMSGIPFGLMSEMLARPNPWHGMVFGMRTRWPWSGDPRDQWKLEDQFGIADSEFIGWWDPACPVTTANPQVKASVFRRQSRTLVTLASWADAPTQIHLGVAWEQLGLDPQRTKFRSPACEGIQPEAVFSVDSPIPVAPGKGWLLIAEETPR